MRYIIILLVLLLSGCSGIAIDRDDHGDITRVYQTGFFPVKGSITNQTSKATLDTKFDLIDINLLKAGN